MTEKTFNILGRRVEIFSTPWAIEAYKRLNSGRPYYQLGLGHIGVRIWSKK